MAEYFPTGMKSVGDVYDELTAKKAVQRIGTRAYAAGDESDATVLTDGATTCYVLPEAVETEADLTLTYKADDFGTEGLLPENGPAPTTSPLTGSVLYPLNAVDTVRNLPRNYVSLSTFDKLRAALAPWFTVSRSWNAAALSMWIVNFTGFKNDHNQLFVSAVWGLILAAYAFTLPNCPVSRGKKSSSLIDAFGLRAFTLFKDVRMCVFFIFSFLLGMCLQVTNGFATPYLDAFGQLPEYANAFAVKNNVFLSSISQVSETLCILLIPFFLKKFGIKKVMLISFFAWFLRFAFLGAGNPTGWGLVLFILSMIVYGVAFDFFTCSWMRTSAGRRFA